MNREDIEMEGREYLDLIALGAVWHKRLNDSQAWTDRNGDKTLIERLDPEHRLNILGYLRKNSARIQHVVGLYELSRMEIGQDQWAEPETPLEWIRETPCFRALVAAVG
jgi:hypothetical protein